MPSDAYQSRVPPEDPGAYPQPPAIPRRGFVPGTHAGKSPGSMEEAVVRANRALELRMAGATWQQIADTLGYRHPSSARQAVNRALEREQDRMVSLRDEYRTIQLLRTERALRAIWSQVVAGDLFAVDRMLKIMERQAKLMGLDAPTQVTITEETKGELVTLISDLERVLIPGEVADADSTGGGDGEAGSDQAAPDAGPDGGEGSSGLEGGDWFADPPGDEGFVESLSMAGAADFGADDGDVDDARWSGDGQDGGGEPLP